MNCKFCGAPLVARNSKTEFPFTTFECEAYIFDDPSIPPARTVECRDGELARIKSELTAWRDLAERLAGTLKSLHEVVSNQRNCQTTADAALMVWKFTPVMEATDVALTEFNQLKNRNERH